MAIDTTMLTDLVLGKLSPEESLRMLREIEHDPQASQELEARTRLLAHVREGGEALFAGRNAVAGTSPLAQARRWWASCPVAGYAIGAAVVLLIALVPVVNVLTKGPLVDLARVGYPQYEAVLRSAGDSDIGLAVRMLRGGHPQESLLLLERFCRAYPENDMREYAHYLAGAIYLSDAQESLLGMFVSYDLSRVRAGMTHLGEALRFSGNPRLTEESHWLRAKGFLMLERPAEALAELETVRRLDGARANDAAQLMGKILSQE